MEVEPADARPASWASGPANTAPTDMSAQKRPPRLGNRLQGPQGQSTLHLRRTLCRPCAALWRVLF